MTERMNTSSLLLASPSSRASQSLSVPHPPGHRKMANEHRPPSPRSPLLEALPFIVVVLIAAHVFALVYWIYKLATEKQPQRRKAH